MRNAAVPAAVPATSRRRQGRTDVREDAHGTAGEDASVPLISARNCADPHPPFGHLLPLRREKDLDAHDWRVNKRPAPDNQQPATDN
jgi:hypothetical protein